jgi:hypothetical protein
MDRSSLFFDLDNKQLSSGPSVQLILSARADRIELFESACLNE